MYSYSSRKGSQARDSTSPARTAAAIATAIEESGIESNRSSKTSGANNEWIVVVLCYVVITLLLFLPLLLIVVVVLIASLSTI
jgi:uncharacterized membrane protein